MSAQRIEILALAQQTADGNSAAFLLSTAREGVLYVNITAATALSDLDLWLQASNDDATTWFDVPCDLRLQDGTTTVSANVRDVVSNATAASKWVGVFKALPYKHVRVKWDMSGTNFTASVVLDVK